MAVSRPISLRIGGYGPPNTSFSRALKRIGDRLEAELGDRVRIHYVWNVLDFGYRAEDILWLVEHGILTLGYQSSSYLTDRIPELGLVDLPFLFGTPQQARAAMDGGLGAFLTRAIEQSAGYRILGYFENGLRHVSNRLRPVRVPSDLAGMRIRVLPSRVHARTFELLGAVPLRLDLTEALQGIAAGRIDAQENPLANTVTYGVHQHHRFHSLTGHFYVSRPIFIHAETFEGWPDGVKQAMRSAVIDAVAYQRELATEEEQQAGKAIREQGCEILELTPEAHEAFVTAVRPLLAEARQVYGDEAWELVEST
jgi:TRAP-type transport system periplasmic protein